MSQPGDQNKQILHIPLEKLTEETIRSSIKSGDTPLHRAAKNGKIHEIPGHLLQPELFMVKNNAGETPLHLAAKYRHLDKVPQQFLTEETITTPIGCGEYLTGSGYRAKTETVLHIAARCCPEQIPHQFLIPEFLSIEATGYRLTVLHDLAYSNRLDLVSDTYATSDIWNLRNSSGQTTREILEDKSQREIYVARVRNEPATEKQKEKLHWFGCAWDEGITKGQASDALDECAKHFPERNAEYYKRPATQEQLSTLRVLLKRDGETPEDYAQEGESLSYERAKDLIWECEMDERSNSEQEYFAELEKEYLLDVELWAELYPGLTWKRVQKAAHALDETRSGWRTEKGDIDIMLAKVAELNPKLAERWQRTRL